MSQPQHNKGNQPPQKLSENAIEQLLKNQNQQLLNEQAEINLRKVEIEYNAKHADKIIDVQRELLKNAPEQRRKIIRTWAWAGGSILVCLMLFILVCLYLGKESFVIQLVQILGYFATTIIGYYFGRQSVQHNGKDKSENVDFEEIN